MRTDARTGSARPSQIGICALYVHWGVNAGTETYLTNIIYPWYEKNPEHSVFTLFCTEQPPWWQGEKPWFHIRIIDWASSILGRVLAEQLVLPISGYRGLDVLYCPGYVGSLTTGTPQVVTVHDLFAWRYPAEIGTLRSFYWRLLIPLSVRRARRTIAVSRNTAHDICRTFSIDTGKVSVVTEGGGHLEGIEPDYSVLNRLGLAQNGYFLCVGFFKEIKNPWRILEAYRRYRTKKSETELKQLVLVGILQGAAASEIHRAASTTEGVVMPGRVTDAELAALYRRGAALLFPSLYEGFGIPILEAQSLRCPVITSNVSSMPEVAGDGAIFVDPLSVDDIASAMLGLETDKVELLVRQGVRNSERFSWDQSSRDTLEILLDTVS